jgi:inner membrane protein
MRLSNKTTHFRRGRGLRRVSAARLLAQATLSPPTLLIAAALLCAADWGYRRVGASVIPGGLLDETAHLMTTLLVVWALGPTVCRRFMAPALIASVVIDLDHVAAEFGYYEFTRGTPRPYTHSLVTVAVALVVAVLWRRRRDLMLGIALGLIVHIVRDMAESDAGVSLLWPWSDHGYAISHAGYLAAIGAVAVAGAVRLLVAARRVFRASRRPLSA